MKKGETKNRKGRPKGAKNRKTIMKEIIAEKHWVQEDGKKVRRTILEFILFAIRNHALKGNGKAFRNLHKLMNQYASQETSCQCGYLVAPAEMTPEEWISRAEAENQRKILEDKL